MQPKAKFTGATPNVRSINLRLSSIMLIAAAAALFAACSGDNSTTGGPTDNETAATVNGKVIRMEEVERLLKQQAQGQRDRLSDLELAGARLQVLQNLIEQEVMFQKAEAEGTVPSEDEITAEINKQKTQSGKSADQIAKEMADAGVTEASLRDQARKALAIQKLIDKITGRIEPPKETEIEAFYNGNKEAFVKRRGVRLAAIVIDPANSGQGDSTTDEQSAVIRGNEVIKKLQAGQDFSSLAREFSEDQSRLQGGDLGWVAEDEMRQNFPPQLVANLMSPDTQIGKLLTAPMMGKFYILKLQDRSDRDEALTLDSPGMRQQVTDSLVNSRKQLLAASYQAIAMNEAKVENHLARKVVGNPNELSGARPAPVGTSTNSNSVPTNISNTAGSNSANVNSARPSNANAQATNSANANRPR